MPAKLYGLGPSNAKAITSSEWKFIFIIKLYTETYLQFVLVVAMAKMDEQSFTFLVVILFKADTIRLQKTRLKETSGRLAQIRTRYSKTTIGVPRAITLKVVFSSSKQHL